MTTTLTGMPPVGIVIGKKPKTLPSAPIRAMKAIDLARMLVGGFRPDLTLPL